MKKTIILIIGSLMMLSCLKDLGNYEYHELTEPEISGIPDTLVLKEDRRIRLAPTLGENVFPEDRYSCEWKAVSRKGETFLLGKSPVLDTEITLLPGFYTLIFRVTEKATGIFWQGKCQLQISDVTSEGWMVLCSEGAERRARLDMYSTISDAVLTDVMKGNGMPALHGPYRISWMQGNLVDGDSPFYLTTEEGCTRLGKNGFEWKEEYRIDYEMGRQGSPAPVLVNEVVNGKMICGKDKVYYSDCVVGTGLFAEISPSLKAAPVIGANIVNHNILIPMAILYDLEGKRFMGYAPNLRDDLMGGAEPLHEMNEMVQLLKNLSNGGAITGNAFEEFPEGMDYVWMENTQYDPNKTGTGITYAVLKDASGYQLYGMQTGELLGGTDFNGPAFAIGKAYHADLSSCEHISEAEHFAFSSLRGLMYYSVGGTVYRADLSDKDHITTTIQTVLEGEQISVLKFNIYKNQELYLRNYDLVVGSNRDGRGTLRIYEGFRSEGDFTGVKPEVHTGFGEIVDITYRENLE